jgi:hypothetical protein
MHIDLQRTYGRNIRKERIQMERFLREYIKDMAEAMGVKLTQKQMHTVLNNIERDEVVWDVLDEHIKNEIEEMI